MSQYRKKPVVIDALLFDGSRESAAVVAEWCHGGYPNAEPYYVDIITMEGVMRASPGDYVIRGVKGEFYPCKPDIFAATYEPVGAGTDVPGAQ